MSLFVKLRPSRSWVNRSADRALGALESGVDIGRRIAAMYRTCRSPEELARAFDYEADGSIVSVLQPYIGLSGWLELAKRAVETLDTEEFLLAATVTDEWDCLDEIARKLFLLPAAIHHDDALSVPDHSAYYR